MTPSVSTAQTPSVSLLGGESSGKSSLAHALADHLKQQYGLRVTVVDEHLRHWCETQKRAPLAHEQAAIALQQSALIHAARAQPGTQLVIADTSALMVAIYSTLYFQDHSLLPGAIEQQRGHDLTLLMGLDLPWVGDGFFRDSPKLRADADALLRDTLNEAGLRFDTVYGHGERRLHNALRALSPLLSPLLGGMPLTDEPPATKRSPAWVCEACSDPDCEHRLFTALLRKT